MKNVPLNHLAFISDGGYYEEPHITSKTNYMIWELLFHFFILEYKSDHSTRVQYNY